MYYCYTDPATGEDTTQWEHPAAAEYQKMYNKEKNRLHTAKREAVAALTQGKTKLKDLRRHFTAMVRPTVHSIVLCSATDG
jgi:hypothetical protein